MPGESLTNDNCNGTTVPPQDDPCEQVVLLNGREKKSMTTCLDTETIRAAYDDVRSDSSPTQWAVFKYEGAKIGLSASGANFCQFRDQFNDEDRAFGYIRLQTGDELSKRQKFLFVTWVGPAVSPIQRAKVSIDKYIVKSIITNFAVELQVENEADFKVDYFINELNKVGGAIYGTGIREP